MLRHRLSHKSKSTPHTILTISVGINVFLGLLVYALFGWVIFRAPSIISVTYKVLVAVTCILIAVVVHLSFALLSGVKKEQIQMADLKNFKNFINAIHYAETDIEAYGILRDFIIMMNLADEVSLVYKTTDHNDSASWQGISAENASVCDMYYNSCPLLNSDRDFIYGNLDDETKCPLKIKETRKGSYACLLINEEEHFNSIFQLYSRKENTLNQAVISMVKSYIEIAKPVIKSKHTLNILNKRATTDNLTKLYNRDFLDIYLQNQVEAANLSKQYLSIIMVDVDHFKNTNDTYGHAAGDYVLIRFAELVMKCVRKSDIVVRYGGDEFIVILPSTDTQTASTISERIRYALAESKIRSLDSNDTLFATCSLGISTYPTLCSNRDELLKTADIALYKAKRSGRNCSRVYEGNAGSDKD